MMEVYILNSYQLVFADETGHIDQLEGSKYDENQDRVEYTAVLKTVDGRQQGHLDIGHWLLMNQRTMGYI